MKQSACSIRDQELGRKPLAKSRISRNFSRASVARTFTGDIEGKARSST